MTQITIQATDEQAAALLAGDEAITSKLAADAMAMHDLSAVEVTYTDAAGAPLLILCAA